MTLFGRYLNPSSTPLSDTSSGGFVSSFNIMAGRYRRNSYAPPTPEPSSTSLNDDPSKSTGNTAGQHTKPTYKYYRESVVTVPYEEVMAAKERRASARALEEKKAADKDRFKNYHDEVAAKSDTFMNAGRRWSSGSVGRRMSSTSSKDGIKVDNAGNH